MAQVKIQNKNIFGEVLFEYGKENNTIRETVEEAVRQGANLRNANLRYANLGYADLGKADLGYADLGYADLGNADLRNADLRNADLRNADLGYADLGNADLGNADLRNANLRNANLRNANLGYADLGKADLGYADLGYANLGYADLGKADLGYADLRNADLGYANHIPYIPLNCPSDGAFVGWKKVNGKLVQLLIPEDAKRSSATTMKCRCDKAKVLAITSLDGAEQYDIVLNTNYTNTEYKVGEMVFPNKFDDDRWNECSNGIHFFINKQDVINY